MKKILIIEDDENLCRELADLLTNSGYEAAVLKDFSDALGEIRRAEPDLILLDINIPVCNGEMLLKDLRKESDVPVIMVTSRSGEADEVLSMSYGADDYITKPFSVKLVLMRVEAVLRRIKEREDEKVTTTLSYGNIRLDRESHSASVDGKPISLTHTEYGLLELFMLHPGRVFTRDNLLNEVWGYDFVGEEKTVNIHIMNLRRKLDTDLIETVRGVGYRLGKDN